MTDIDNDGDFPIRMDPEDKARWISALQGNKFQQGRGVLRRKLSTGEIYHCCLGVYAEVCEVPYSRISGTTKDSIYSFMFLGREDSADFTALPDEWAEPRGISSHDQGVLMRMNDQEGCTFAEIADWVADNL